LANSSTLKFQIDKQERGDPVNWESVKILATFDNDNNQANITTTNLEFVNEAAKYISERFKSGLTNNLGAFEGPDFDIFASDDEGFFQAFEGFIDYTKDYTESNFIKQDVTNPLKTSVGIKKLSGLNTLDELINGATYGLFKEKGIFTNSDYKDLPWVVQKKFDALEFAILNITIFITVKEAVEQIQRLADDIKMFASLLISATPPSTGAPGAILNAVLTIIVRAAYLAVMIIQLVEMSGQVFNILIPRVRKLKVASFRTLIQKPLEFYGYNLECPIEEIDNLYFLPTLARKESNFQDEFLKKVKVNEEGIPSVEDYGFLFSELLQTFLQMTNSRIAITDERGAKTVHIRTDSDEWWIKNSNLELMKDVLIDERKYNTDELLGRTLIKFETDLIDDWTVDNYTGTSYEVITEPITVDNPQKVSIKGIDEINIPWTLPNPKGTLTPLEKLLLKFATIAEDAVNTVGGNLNLSGKIKDKVNAFKTSGETWNNPRVIWLGSNGIPLNNRDLFSARTLYEKYLIEKSFVENNFRGQKYRFENITIPFGLREFKELIDNAYFTLPNGDLGKVERCEWEVADDKALLSGWVRRPYTFNLKVTKYEP
jgi:hypothetical protein